MASLVLTFAGALISAVVLLQGTAAHIHLANTSAALFRQNAAGPLVGFGLGGLLFSAAAGVGVLTYGRRRSAMAVATGAAALLLAGGRTGRQCPPPPKPAAWRNLPAADRQLPGGSLSHSA